MIGFLARKAAQLLSRKAHAKRRQSIRDTTNAMREHYGLEGRI